MKKSLSLVLALLMLLAALPMSALAAGLPAQVDAPTNPKAALDDDVPEFYYSWTDEIVISMGLTPAVQQYIQQRHDQPDSFTYSFYVQVDWSINSRSDWKCTGTNDWSIPERFGKEALTNPDYNNVPQVLQFSMMRSNYTTPKEGGYDAIVHGITDSGEGFFNLTDNTLYFRARFWMQDWDAQTEVFSDWTPVFSIGKEVDDAANKPVFDASNWAKPELEQASQLGLIPESLQNTDLTKPITRDEFAAVAVKTYEALSGTTALPAVTNPFTDTADVEVLKAYNANLMVGTSSSEFSPDRLLNREEAATALTRVFKRSTMPGWTLATDAAFTLLYDKPAPFADDASIATWAKDSVYFMFANGIINGMGNNIFAPKATTDAERAQGYATATREMAIIIAKRMVEKLG